MMAPGTYSYSVESYALITNLGSSVLKLNPALEPHGFHFLRLGLDELDRGFRNLFGLSPDFDPSGLVGMTSENDQGVITSHVEISPEFGEILMQLNFSDPDIFRSRELILLKRTEDTSQHVRDGYITFDSIGYRVESIRDFSEQLVFQLRLFKLGDVLGRTYFQVAKDTRKVISRFNPSYIHTGGRKFNVDDNEAAEFIQSFKRKIKISKLAEVAFNNFNASYGITEPRAKFLMLMTCLEALFNHKGAEITHTISRHLSILLSGTVEEFQSTYDKARKLYSLRSKIIHGSNVSGNIDESLEELEDFVRKALNRTIDCNIKHEDFFGELNTRGFQISL